MYLKDSKYWSKALVDDGIEYEEIGSTAFNATISTL